MIRIIAGKWKSRRLHFKHAKLLRPTPDRVRETLFNWLAPIITTETIGLDLFAGSGALGLELLSRGAAEVVFIEQSVSITSDLRSNIKVLTAPTALNSTDNGPDNSLNNSLDHEKTAVINTDSLQWLAKRQHHIMRDANKKFDIVFIDPPYKLNVLPQCFSLLENNSWLQAQAWIYYEHNQPITAQQLPDNWQLIKSKRAGDVFFYLATREADDK